MTLHFIPILLTLSTLTSYAFAFHYPSSIPYQTTRKKTLNPIDACWRSDPNWSSNRKSLANCARGFGQSAIGGKLGPIYTVTDPSDNPTDPKPGTLRYGVIQSSPLWIVFKTDMSIKLKNELMVNSFKTIDGRGANIEIAYGPCITIQNVAHVIIHGIYIHDCKRGERGMVRDSMSHVGHRLGSDGDAITIFASSHVWIDHCRLSRAYDGLIDVTHGSAFVTISNNYFSDHDKVMLFGHQDSDPEDRNMKVTVAFNHFGTNLVQRMPRVRTGYAHVANNRYDSWRMYAIGGSSNPTILSEGNYYVAPNDSALKEVTKREEGGWKKWKWRSSKDLFLNGAYFVPSGWGSCAPSYSQTQKFNVAQGAMVPVLTADAGVLRCFYGKPCT